MRVGLDAVCFYGLCGLLTRAVEKSRRWRLSLSGPRLTDGSIGTTMTSPVRCSSFTAFNQSQRYGGHCALLSNTSLSARVPFVSLPPASIALW